jgi:hypothetical protein
MLIVEAAPFSFRASGWSPAHSHFKVVASFITQIQVHPLSPKICQQIEAEIAQVGTFDDAPFPPFPLCWKTNRGSGTCWFLFPLQTQEVLADWMAEGEEAARAKARLWTWHFATSQGRAYLRSGCSSLAQLAGLVAVDPQVGAFFPGGSRDGLCPHIFLYDCCVVCVSKVREEVRLTLLIANRQREGAGGPQVVLLLGDLPRELLHAILFDIGSQRQPPAPSGWERIDDGLPDDWRTRIDDTSVPPAP